MLVLPPWLAVAPPVTEVGEEFSSSIIYSETMIRKKEGLGEIPSSWDIIIGLTVLFAPVLAGTLPEPDISHLCSSLQPESKGT